MVVALRGPNTTTAKPKYKSASSLVVAVIVVSMIWWNSAGDGWKGGVFLFAEGSITNGRSSGIWSNVAPSNVGIAVAVTAMAGIALAATLVYSRRGSLKSPWSRRKRKNALSAQHWKSLFTPDGRFYDGGVKFLKKVRSGGVDPSIRAEVWPFLLGVYDLNSTQEERDAIIIQKRKEYENFRRQCVQLLNESVECIDSKEAHGSNGEGDDGGVDQGLDSPHSDVENAGEPISVGGESPESKGDIDHTHVKNIDSPNSLAEEDDNQSGITDVDVFPVATELSDSDSNEDEEIMLTSPLVEKVGGSDPMTPSGEDSSVSKIKNKLTAQTTEDFTMWQRIIRLDAVRANAEWIVYSPAQAAVSESSARESAEAVGLKDYDHLEPCRILHAARLVAILEAYALLDPEIGYCQGMSDLLSPIIAVVEEDHEAFWCFVGFMKKARHNFRLDEVGIRRQLNLVSKIIKSSDSRLYRHLQKLQAEDCFFVYRMVVVLFRRELTFEQTLCMWEVVWADQAAIRAGISKSSWGKIRLRAPPTEDLLLFAIAACVLQHRKSIIEKSSSMDEIMRECNSMAGHLDVWKLLDDAHALVVSLHDRI